MDKEKILERWSEYVKELLKGERKDCYVMKSNFESPTIRKDQVRAAIKIM